MKPAAFAYHQPKTIEAVLDLLGDLGETGKILAGGQSLVAAMNFRLARPDELFDINAIAALDYLQADGECLRIGALTRHAAFHRPVVETPLGAMLASVARHIAHYPIRQRGTFAGSLAHADPASEWCLVASVLDAEIVARSRSGERVIGARSFFRGTFTTDLRPQELITEVRLPLLDAHWSWGFAEFSRRAGDFALAMALVALRMDGGSVQEARVGVGGVADRPLRLPGVEAGLVGRRPDPSLIEALAGEAAASVEPSEDIHASQAYRRDLMAAMVARALRQAVGIARPAAGIAAE